MLISVRWFANNPTHSPSICGRGNSQTIHFTDSKVFKTTFRATILFHLPATDLSTTCLFRELTSPQIYCSWVGLLVNCTAHFNSGHFMCKLLQAVYRPKFFDWQWVDSQFVERLTVNLCDFQKKYWPWINQLLSSVFCLQIVHIWLNELHPFPPF